MILGVRCSFDTGISPTHNSSKYDPLLTRPGHHSRCTPNSNIKQASKSRHNQLNPYSNLPKALLVQNLVTFCLQSKRKTWAKHCSDYLFRKYGTCLFHCTQWHKQKLEPKDTEPVVIIEQLDKDKHQTQRNTTKYGFCSSHSQRWQSPVPIHLSLPIITVNRECCIAESTCLLLPFKKIGVCSNP